MGLINRTAPVEVADVERREPQYTTIEDHPPTVEDVNTRHYQYGHEFEDLATLPRDGRRVPFAAEARKLVVMDYGQQTQTATLDGTGAGTFDFGGVPTDQWWILDNVVARAGAAGSALLYERGSVSALNDQDLIYAKVLLGPAFALSDYPNETVLRPGSHPIGAMVGGGAAAAATMRIMYRVALLVGGSQEVKP